MICRRLPRQKYRTNCLNTELHRCHSIVIHVEWQNIMNDKYTIPWKKNVILWIINKLICDDMMRAAEKKTEKSQPYGWTESTSFVSKSNLTSLIWNKNSKPHLHFARTIHALHIICIHIIIYKIGSDGELTWSLNDWIN